MNIDLTTETSTITENELSDDELDRHRRFNEWVGRCIKTHGNRYTYYEEYFVNYYTKTKIGCQKHGLVDVHAGGHFRGSNCNQCQLENRSPRYTTEEFIEIAKSIHGDTYLYTKTNYLGRNVKTTITCPTHGDFTQSPGQHLSGKGYGCVKCKRACAYKHRRKTTDEFVERAQMVHNNKYTYEKTIYTTAKSHVIITCHKHGDFSQMANVHTFGGGCPVCGLERSTHTFVSKPEFELLDFIKSHGVTNVIQSDYHLRFQLDLYLPDYKLAIEYNGMHWHSSRSIDTDKKMSAHHHKKTAKCEDSGIQLLHIFEFEWINKHLQEIWKSSILHKLNLSPNKVFARKCSIIQVPLQQAREFLNNNHLQGYAAGSTNYGLVYNGEIVAIASFAKSRFNKGSDAYELLRFATLNYTSVIGGFSKLISYFANKHKGHTLISYANRRWSLGSVYQQCGFTLKSISKPCYYYTNNDYKIHHRSEFQKHKLDKLLPNFDPALTEVQNMYNNGYSRLWDAGHLVYEKQM